MAKWTRDGKLYIKTLNAARVQGNGNEKPVFVKILPPFVVARRFWVHFWITGEKPLDPHQKQQMMISGRMANMGLDASTLANASSHDTMQEMMREYCPIGVDEPQDGDPGGGNWGIGLTSLNEGKQSQFSKDREFIHYECMLGGANAYMTGANKIRYYKEFKKEGAISGHGCNVDQYRMIGISALSDLMVQNAHEDEKEHMWGNSTPDASELTRQAYYFFGEQGQSPFYGDINNASSWENQIITPSALAAGIGAPNALGDGDGDSLMHSDIQKWLTEPYIEDVGSGDHADSNGVIDTSGLFERYGGDADLVLQAKVTVELDLIKRSQRNVYTPE